MDAQRQEELSTLCRTCGTCCTGAMFDHAELFPGEPAPSIRHRLRVLSDDKYGLPCPALGPSGTGCTVYADRPTTCRTYYCALYQQHEREGGDIEDKLAKVRVIRRLAERVMAFRPGECGTDVAVAIMSQSADETERRLDLVELSMRLRRDIGWDPWDTAPTEPKRAPDDG